EVHHLIHYVFRGYLGFLQIRILMLHLLTNDCHLVYGIVIDHLWINPSRSIKTKRCSIFPYRDSLLNRVSNEQYSLCPSHAYFSSIIQAIIASIKIGKRIIKEIKHASTALLPDLIWKHRNSCKKKGTLKWLDLLLLIIQILIFAGKQIHHHIKLVWLTI
ncbi:hypothetical protein ACJX0J_027940, partial [Zea mays]